MTNLFFDCWLLDAVDDDFTAVWELASVLQHKQPNVDESIVSYQLLSRLLELYERNFIKFYEGLLFNGDEVEIAVVINDSFIKNEMTDALNNDISKPITKLHITEKGRNFYLFECKSYMFS